MKSENVNSDVTPLPDQEGKHIPGESILNPDLPSFPPEPLPDKENLPFDLPSFTFGLPSVANDSWSFESFDDDGDDGDIDPINDSPAKNDPPQTELVSDRQPPASTKPTRKVRFKRWAITPGNYELEKSARIELVKAGIKMGIETKNGNQITEKERLQPSVTIGKPRRGILPDGSDDIFVIVTAYSYLGGVSYQIPIPTDDLHTKFGLKDHTKLETFTVKIPLEN